PTLFRSPVSWRLRREPDDHDDGPRAPRRKGNRRGILSRQMVGLEAWYGAGQRARVSPVSGQPVELFYRQLGRGRSVTLLHGFPTCSWDWSALADGLSDYQLLMPDLLGFGDSDKPPGHHYTLMEQADLIAALWDQ